HLFIYFRVYCISDLRWLSRDRIQLGERLAHQEQYRSYSCVNSRCWCDVHNGFASPSLYPPCDRSCYPLVGRIRPGPSYTNRRALVFPVTHHCVCGTEPISSSV